MSMNTVPERLAALRAAMQANGVDVYLIPVGGTARSTRIFYSMYWKISACGAS